MGNLLDWNKLSEKDKKRLAKLRNLVFVPGPVQMSRRRISQIKSLVRSNLLFGVLKDEEIPGLEGSPHFQPLKLEELQKAVGRDKKVIILQHFHKDIKYIIKELLPARVVFVNGSWGGQIHYRSDYWKAIEVGAKVQLISPFSSEREARAYEKRIANSEQRIVKGFYKRSKKYSDKELMLIAKEAAKLSWDWIGQIGSVLARNGKILTVAWNRVVPYQACQMHHGSIREQKYIPAQEMIETQLTNHAECEILEIARKKKINLKNTSLFINIFPCPVCAKMLSRTDIKQVVYEQDHNLANNVGYSVLEASGVKIRRIVPSS